mgnify:FL=1
MYSAEIINSVIIIAVMLTLSAFFSGMEIAFLSKNRLMVEIGRKQSRFFDMVAGLFERHPGQYITTILVGNNICLVIYSLSMSTLLRLLAQAAGWESLALNGSVITETVISTIVILFCGEFLPKSIVKNNPNFYYSTLYPVILFFYLLLYPIAIFTTWLSYGILRLFGHKAVKTDISASFNRDDLVNLMDAETVEPQEEEEDEIKMFQNALDFADLRVRDCMVSRVDVEAVDIDDTTIEQLTERFIESKFSRIFVWRESIDNIIGYVNSKSLFEKPASIGDVMKKVSCVAETLPLQNMLQTFIKQKSSVAVVIDEFGGTAGIISIQDVLEEIFGDIEDEHDVHRTVEKKVGEGEYIFSCRLEVEYLNEHYDLGIEESDEYDTLAGYIIRKYEGIPAAGETLIEDGLEIHILRSTRARVELARVKKM